MAGTYGAAGQNRFSIPNVTGFFSTIVNAQTGVTQVYRQGAATTEQSVGTYNPSTGRFTAQSNNSLTPLLNLIPLPTTKSGFLA